MQTILSYGMGVESTAILIRWLEDASVRPRQLDELIVITAHTGDEYADTYRDVETYVLPLLRMHRIRYVQVARGGSSQTDGIVVLSDSRETETLFWDGAYKLSDELRKAAGRNRPPVWGRAYLQPQVQSLGDRTVVCRKPGATYEARVWLQRYRN